MRLRRARGGLPGVEGRDLQEFRGCLPGEAIRQLEERRARWEARDSEAYWRAYMETRARLRRPDPAACMRRLLKMKRRWLEEDYGR
jgi:hypothetical protein